jgi:hypothetical protein
MQERDARRVTLRPAIRSATQRRSSPPGRPDSRVRRRVPAPSMRNRPAHTGVTLLDGPRRPERACCAAEPVDTHGRRPVARAGKPAPSRGRPLVPVDMRWRGAAEAVTVYATLMVSRSSLLNGPHVHVRACQQEACAASARAPALGSSAARASPAATGLRQPVRQQSGGQAHQPGTPVHCPLPTACPAGLGSPAGRRRVSRSPAALRQCGGGAEDTAPAGFRGGNGAGA